MPKIYLERTYFEKMINICLRNNK